VFFFLPFPQSFFSTSISFVSFIFSFLTRSGFLGPGLGWLLRRETYERHLKKGWPEWCAPPLRVLIVVVVVWWWWFASQRTHHRRGASLLFATMCCWACSRCVACGCCVFCVYACVLCLCVLCVIVWTQHAHPTEPHTRSVALGTGTTGTTGSAPTSRWTASCRRYLATATLVPSALP
jgi:hypothetical protein